jgi:hypothetical protein
MPRRSFSRSRSYDRKSYDRRGGGYRGRSRTPPRDRGGERGGYRGGGPPLSSDNQIYVARFGRRTTESDLRKAFEKYGYIDKIDLKEGRGFGFIVSAKLSFFLILFDVWNSTLKTEEMRRTPSRI